MEYMLNRLITQYKRTPSPTVRIAVRDETTDEKILAELKRREYVSDFLIISVTASYKYWVCTLTQKTIDEATTKPQQKQSEASTISNQENCISVQSCNSSNTKSKTVAGAGIKGYLILWSGIICFILPWIIPYIIPKSWDSELLGFIVCAILLYGMIAPFVGLHVIGTEKEEARTKRHSAYNNPQWRRENPELAALVEKERKEEIARQAEYARKRKAQAVVVQEALLGHFDSPGSAWFLGGFPDYAGGWDIKCAVTNVGVETIKYVHVVFAAYNAVGDVCRTSFNQDAVTKCIFTGPISPGCSSGPRGFMHVWYDIVPKSLKVESIHVEFMNGTSQDIDKFGKVTNHGF